MIRILVCEVAYRTYKKLTAPATYNQQPLSVPFTWGKQTGHGTLELRAQAVASQNSTECHSEQSVKMVLLCLTESQSHRQHHQCRRLVSDRLSSLSR